MHQLNPDLIEELKPLEIIRVVMNSALIPVEFLSKRLKALEKILLFT